MRVVGDVLINISRSNIFLTLLLSPLTDLCLYEIVQTNAHSWKDISIRNVNLFTTTNKLNELIYFE